MKTSGWWNAETLFVTGLGVVMAVFFGAACLFSQRTATAGNDLVPASVLEKLVEEGRRCQTVTDQDVLLRAPRRVC